MPMSSVSRSVVLAATAALALLAAFAGRAHAWRYRTPGYGMAVALDANGDVGVAASFHPEFFGGFGIVKLAGGSGSELWRHEVAAAGIPWSIAVDPADQFVAAGTINDGIDEFTVVKVDGANGGEVWRRELSLGVLDQEARSLAVDGAGNVVAAGTLLQLMPGPDISWGAIVKLSGVDGSGIWEKPQAVPGSLTDVAIDGAGDVVAAGGFITGGFLVAKLSGGDGSLSWSFNAVPGSARALAVHPSGDVIVIGDLDSSWQAVRIDGATGAEVWRHSCGSHGYGVVVDAGGDVVAIGDTDHPASGLDFTVVKLAGADGSELWRREITSPGAMADFGLALRLDGAGDVIAAGQLGNELAADFLVAKFSGAAGDEIWRRRWSSLLNGGGLDGAVDVAVDAGVVVAVGGLDSSAELGAFQLSPVDGATSLLSGLRLDVRDDAGDDTRRRITAVSKDPLLAVGAPGSAADPSLHGATLRLRNPSTGELADFTLPAGAAWQASAGQYIYRDPSGANGPCRRLLVRQGKLAVRCSARGSFIPFSLDEATQGSLVLGVRLGGGGAQCMAFGGTIRRDAGTTNPGPRGLFVARATAVAAGVDCSLP